MRVIELSFAMMAGPGGEPVTDQQFRPVWRCSATYILNEEHNNASQHTATWEAGADDIRQLTMLGNEWIGPRLRELHVEPEEGFKPNRPRLIKDEPQA